MILCYKKKRKKRILKRENPKSKKDTKENRIYCSTGEHGPPASPTVEPWLGPNIPGPGPLVLGWIWSIIQGPFYGSPYGLHQEVI